MTLNARAILIQSKTLGTDTLVDTILTEPGSPEVKLFAQAKSLNLIPLKKQYVEASLIASNNFNAISELLEIPVEVITMYHDTFYDLTGMDRLTKMDLLNVPDKNESLLKLWAMSQGLDFIAWRLGSKVTVSPIEGLQELFTTCIYKAKEAMFNGNTSDSSKESTKWVKLSMDLARLLKVWVLDSAAAKHDIEIALREVVPNFGGLDSLQAEMEQMDSVIDTTGVSELSLEDLQKENSE